MGKFSVSASCLLTCLVRLATATPDPLTLQATTLLGNSSANNLPDTNLAAAVIPTDFTIKPSLPLNEPILNQRNTLLLTLLALGDLGIEDFIGQQRSQTWRSLQHVSIDIVGPAKTVESFIPVRKYAVWGIYKAIHLMVASNDFRPRNYELFWQGTLAGYVSFNDGARAALDIGGSSTNGTDTAVQKKDLSDSLIPLLPNVTSTNLKSTDVSFTYEFTGRTIGEANVFMTLFTGILKAAPYYQTERVDAFTVNTRTFNSYLSFKGREDQGPGDPYLEYTHLIQLFAQLPTWMIQRGGRWTEAAMVAYVDDKVVGAGVMKWQDRSISPSS